MCTPSNASGAVPLTTISTSARSKPAESRAMRVASKQSSFPVSWRRRRKRVMPAPITPTFFIDRPPGLRPLPSRSERSARTARRRPARRRPDGSPPRREAGGRPRRLRSEEHTSELQSQFHLVCRLLLEKKKKKKKKKKIKKKKKENKKKID